VTPPLSLLVRPAAQEDITRATLWYERRAAGLGARFREDVEGTLVAIREQPELFRLMHRDVRRALLREFPYAVYFVLRGDAIHVLACIHGRRHPRHWRQRTR